MTIEHTQKSKSFFKYVLRAAAIYNTLWGLWVGLFPFALFDFAGLERPNYPEIWQCVGMIVGVYGVGYWIASYNPHRHWPIVFVGMLGKIFGPIGFVYALANGVYNLKFGLTILTNDLIWWVPFFMILKSAWTEILNPPLPPRQEPDALKSHEHIRPLFSGRWLVLCVRHSGCTFCREELADFPGAAERFHQAGIKTAVVHMGSQESGLAMQERYQLPSTYFVADPQRQLYRLFELKRGSWGELIGPKNWWRGFKAGVLKGHGVGALEGDGKQMGGVVYFENGNFKVLHRATYAGDLGDMNQIRKILRL